MGFVLFVFLIWIGFFWGLPAIKFVRTQNSLRNQWQHVNAQVIDKIYNETIPRNQLKTPLVQYELNGKKNQSISEYFTFNILCLLPIWKNKPIKILVDPKDNNRWIIDVKYVRFIFFIWLLMYIALTIYGLSLYELSL